MVVDIYKNEYLLEEVWFYDKYYKAVVEVSADLDVKDGDLDSKYTKLSCYNEDDQITFICVNPDMEIFNEHQIEYISNLFSNDYTSWKRLCNNDFNPWDMYPY
jgi:hypothetical protein